MVAAGHVSALALVAANQVLVAPDQLAAAAPWSVAAAH